MNLDLHDTLLFIGGLASIVTVLGGIYKLWQIGIRDAWEDIKLKLARIFYKIPKKTLIILPDKSHSIWWSMGTINGNPAMQICGDFYFTNISREPILIPKTYLVACSRKWGFIPSRTRAEGNIFIKRFANNIYGNYSIPPRLTTDGRADWWIEPPIEKKGKSFRGKVCFVDQYGNAHWTKTLTWKYQ